MANWMPMCEAPTRFGLPCPWRSYWEWSGWCDGEYADGWYCKRHAQARLAAFGGVLLRMAGTSPVDLVTTREIGTVSRVRGRYSSFHAPLEES